MNVARFSLRCKAMVKMDLGYFFEAMRCILNGDFVEAQRYLFHSAWTPSDKVRT